ERDERVREPAYAALVGQRLPEGATEHDADVLHGVVEVDAEVALGVDDEVEAGVLAELLEHVVEERDAGIDLGGAASFHDARPRATRGSHRARPGRHRPGRAPRRGTPPASPSLHGSRARWCRRAGSAPKGCTAAGPFRARRPSRSVPPRSRAAPRPSTTPSNT